MKRKVGSTEGFTILNVQAIPLCHRLPVGHTGPAERIDAELQSGRLDDIQIDDVLKIPDIGPDIIMLVGRACTTSLVIRQTLHALQIGGKEGIRAILNPFRHLGIGRPTMRWVILDAAVLRRIVRGGDDDAVGEPRCSPSIVGEDRVRDDRSGGVPIILIDHHLNAVRCQHLERARTSWFRECVCIPAEIQRPDCALAGAIFTDRLRDGQDMPFVKASLEGRTPMSRRAKGHSLLTNHGIGLLRKIGCDELRDIDENRCRRGTVRQEDEWPYVLCSPEALRLSTVRSQNDQCPASGSNWQEDAVSGDGIQRHLLGNDAIVTFVGGTKIPGKALPTDTFLGDDRF